MLQLQSSPFSGLIRTHRLKKLAKQVRAGHVPAGTSKEDVYEALRMTKPKGTVEMFGMLYARQFRDGILLEDKGLVGVKKVTLEFVKYMVDALIGSTDAANFDHFNAHAMGEGSTAEASGDQALVTQKDGRNIGSQTHGSTSNIYKSVATITATAAYSCCEHGLFNQTSTTGDLLLDRSIVTTFIVQTDDEVEWTYELTANCET